MARPRGYLFTVARRAALDRVHRRRPSEPLPEDHAGLLVAAAMAPTLAELRPGGRVNTLDRWELPAR